MGPSQVLRTQSRSAQVTERSKFLAIQARKSVTPPALGTALATLPRVWGRPCSQTSHSQSGWVTPCQAVFSAPDSPLAPVKPERTSR